MDFAGPTKKLGVTASLLEDKIGDLAPMIKARGSSAREEKRVQRLVETTESVKLACDVLRASHKSISSRTIGEIIGRSEDGPYMRKAIKLVRESAWRVSTQAGSAEECPTLAGEPPPWIGGGHEIREL